MRLARGPPLGEPRPSAAPAARREARGFAGKTVAIAPNRRHPCRDDGGAPTTTGVTGEAAAFTTRS